MQSARTQQSSILPVNQVRWPTVVRPLIPANRATWRASDAREGGCGPWFVVCVPSAERDRGMVVSRPSQPPSGGREATPNVAEPRRVREERSVGVILLVLVRPGHTAPCAPSPLLWPPSPLPFAVGMTPPPLCCPLPRLVVPSLD